MPDDKPPPDDQRETWSADHDAEPGDRSTPQKRLGDFELLHELGRGGMGIVYEARQISLKRRVALKLLPPGLGLSGEAVQRFEREAQAAAKLHHTNIVPVYAIGEEEGCHYYAMELVEGLSLERILADVQQQETRTLKEETITRLFDQADGEPDSSEEQKKVSSASRPDVSSTGRKWFDIVARQLAAVADALEHAHSRGVIHRDIKPANLLLSPEGRLCITDFGLALVAQEPGMTATGAFLGTPSYMSPEQARGQKADRRTDIYSLGVVLYEMLTLQRPFAGESWERIVHAILTRDPASPRSINPRVPVDLETICLKAMEKDPDRRYQTAEELASDFRQYLQRGLIAARRASVARRTWKSIRHHPVAAVSVAAVLIVVVVGGFAWQASVKRASEAAHRAVADARLALSDGEYRVALKSVDEALALDHELLDARLIRAQALIKLDRTDEALDEANALLDRAPDDWRPHLLLAGLARAWETAGEAPTISVREHIAVVEAKAPETADAYYLRSLIAETPKEAVVLLDSALALDAGHVEALLERVRRYEQLKEYQVALQDCERLITARPRSAQGRRAKAFLYRQSGDLLGALTEAEEAVRLDENDPANYRERAQANVGLGRYQEAIEDITSAVDLNPAQAIYHSMRAGWHNMAGQFDEAVADAQRALELNPNLLDAYGHLLGAHLQLGRRADVITALTRLAEASASWADEQARCSAMHTLAYFYFQIGDTAAALEEATRAIEIDSERPAVFLLRSRISRSLGNMAGAEADCNAAARLILDSESAPDERSMSMELGRVCGLWDLAIAGSDKLIEDFPRWYMPFIGRCIVNIYMGRPVENALSDCTRAIELSPRNFLGYMNRSGVYERMRRLDEATADASKAVEYHPYNAALRYNYAWFLFNSGKPEAALVQSGKAIELDPHHASAHAERGRELACLGRCDEAKEAILHAGQIAAASEVRSAMDIGSLGDVAESRLHAELCGCAGLYDLVSGLEDARAGAEHFPGDSRYLTIYGFALYRAERYDEASRVLAEAIERAGQESAHDLFLSAMAAQRLGDSAKAQSSFDRAVDWMEGYEPANPVLVNLRREAAGLLGLDP